MIWSAWNNGLQMPSGAGYGLRVPRADRDSQFSQKWEYVLIELPSGNSFKTVRVKVSKSFWKHQNPCIELRSQTVGKWFRDNGYAPWKHRSPPKFRIKLVGYRKFQIESTC